MKIVRTDQAGCDKTKWSYMVNRRGKIGHTNFIHEMKNGVCIQ